MVLRVENNSYEERLAVFRNHSGRAFRLYNATHSGLTYVNFMSAFLSINTAYVAAVHGNVLGMVISAGVGAISLGNIVSSMQERKRINDKRQDMQATIPDTIEGDVYDPELVIALNRHGYDDTCLKQLQHKACDQRMRGAIFSFVGVPVMFLFTYGSLVLPLIALQGMLPLVMGGKSSMRRAELEAAKSLHSHKGLYPSIK